MRTLTKRAALLLAISLLFIACDDSEDPQATDMTSDTTTSGDTTPADSTDPGDTTTSDVDDTSEPGDTTQVDSSETDTTAMDTTTSDTTTTDTTEADTSTMDTSMMDTTPACNGNEMLCGGTCVDVTSSEAHCGMCDAACTDNETCVDGTCMVAMGVSYATDVKPIFDSRCTSCHGANHYTRWVNKSANQCAGETFIIPGDADGSYVVHKIENTQACGGSMPPGPGLNAGQIATIRQWIDEGALDN